MIQAAAAAFALFLAWPASLSAETQVCAKECTQGDCNNGPGLQVYTNCDRYKGEFSSGQREGRGEYFFANGDVYSGNFSAGRRAGQGVYRFKQGQGEDTVFESSMDSKGNGKGALRIGTAVTECTIVSFVTECGQTGRVVLSEKMEPLGLVLYSGPGSVVQRGRRSLPVKPGDPVMPGDALQSGHENLDMQFNGQVALRMKPNTALSVGSDPVDKRVNLEKGEVIVKFEKETGGLSVRAPAAHVEAEGSTLSVRTTDKETDVRVFEVRSGKVVVSPALPELEGKSRREIEADPVLKKLEEKRISLARPVAQSTGTLVPAISDSASAKPADVRPFTPTVKERMEAKAVVAVEEKPGLQSRQILDSYRSRTQAAMTSIEKDLEETVLTSDDDIMKHYGLVEKLMLQSGQEIRGATITQAGDTLVVHTIRRTVRVRTADLQYIDYIQKGDLP